MDIITKTLDQATRLLGAVRAKYIIVMPDGETRELGGLKLHVEPETPVRSRVQRVASGTYRDIYKEPMDKMSVGDVWAYPCGEGVDPNGLRGAAGAHGAKKWGNNSVLTSINQTTRTVEVLRVS